MSRPEQKRHGVGPDNIHGVRNRRLTLLLILAALSMGACSRGGSTDGHRQTPRDGHSEIPSVESSRPATSTPTSQPRPGSRIILISNLLLGPHDWMALSLHPTTQPIALRGPSTVEACPGTLDGRESASGSSWPRSFHFDACIRLRGSLAVELPRSDGEYHLGVLLRSVSKSTVHVGKLDVLYDAADRYFEYFPPTQITPSSSELTFRPRLDGQVGLMLINPGRASSTKTRSVSLVQGGRPLALLPGISANAEQLIYPRVVADEPVTVRLPNGQVGKARYGIVIEWD